MENTIQNEKKSFSQRIENLRIGENLIISLKEIKYTSINSALYRKRIEGKEFSSKLINDRKEVIIYRIK